MRVLSTSLAQTAAAHCKASRGVLAAYVCSCVVCVYVRVHLSQLFNTRKMSPVFTSPVENEVPPVFVDRLGLKAWTSYNGGQDNSVEHALILQQVPVNTSARTHRCKARAKAMHLYCSNYARRQTQSATSLHCMTAAGRKWQPQVYARLLVPALGPKCVCACVCV